MGGFFCPDTPFFSQLSEGIDLECKQHNYILNTLFLYEGDDIPKHLNMIKQNGAKGIILLGSQMQKLDISFFSQCPVPIVLLDNQPGYLHSSYSLYNFEERATGFNKALHKNGMSSFHSIIHKVAPSVEGTYADIKNLLAQNIPIASCAEPPTPIFSFFLFNFTLTESARTCADGNTVTTVIASTIDIATIWLPCLILHIVIPPYIIFYKYNNPET